MNADRGRTRTQILDSAIRLVGHFGVKKTSVDDLARAAGLSKQGLYLHFPSKDELLREALRRYFEEGLRLTREALDRPGTPLNERLVDALDAWFGRHLEHFSPATLEVTQASDPGASEVETVKAAYCSLLEAAIADAPEYTQRSQACTPRELTQVLFQFGLTWKEGHASRAAFRQTLELCVRACLPARRGRAAPRGAS